MKIKVQQIKMQAGTTSRLPKLTAAMMLQWIPLLWYWRTMSRLTECLKTGQKQGQKDNSSAQATPDARQLPPVQIRQVFHPSTGHKRLVDAPCIPEATPCYLQSTQPILQQCKFLQKLMAEVWSLLMPLDINLDRSVDDCQLPLE